MKTQFIKNTIATFFLAFIFLFSHSQNCTQCDNTGNPIGNYASEVGQNTTAEGICSFSGGVNSQSLGNYSFSFGNTAHALSAHSFALGGFTTATNSMAFAIGNNCTAGGTSSFVLGEGLNSSNILINPISHSMMIGFKSDKPTLFIGSALGVGYTGRIGIGNVTDPLAKLHIKGDDNEDADLLLEPGINKYAKIKFGGTGTANRIEAKGTLDLNFHTASDFVFWDGNVGIGNYNPAEKLDVSGNIKSTGFILNNGQQATGKILQSDANGLASWVDPMSLTVDDGDWTINGNDVYRLSGNVGIGTTAPQCRFQISDNKGNLDAEFFKVSNDNVLGGGTTLIGKDAGNGPVLVQQAGDMNFSTGGPRLAIKQKANNGAVGLDISTFTDQSGAIAWANIEAPNSSFYLISSSDLIFRTGAGQNQVYFTANGNVGIGVSAPQAKLDVDGKILCGELEIVNLGYWKDDVLGSGYHLAPLNEVEQYINMNGHLPEIPSETEVLENGYNVGEMDALLLQKIEELTLYVINLKKELQELKGE